MGKSELQDPAGYYDYVDVGEWAKRSERPSWRGLSAVLYWTGSVVSLRLPNDAVQDRTGGWGQPGGARSLSSWSCAAKAPLPSC